MKKILLGTSALISAAALSGAAFAGGGSGMGTGNTSTTAAGGVELTIGGSADWQAGIVDQDLDGTGSGRYSSDFKFANQTQLKLHAKGMADNGLKYGAVIELNADVNANPDGQGDNARRTYLYVESQAGRVEMGSNTGAAGTMKVDASNIARATGGIEGDFYRYVDLGGASFVVRPDLPTDHGTAAAIGNTENSNKVTYYSPSFSGVQVGVSYSPDEGDIGTSAGFTGDEGSDQTDVWQLGASYEGNFSGVALVLAATGEFGNQESSALEDLSAWNVGGSLSSHGFSVAGSYGDWGDSGLAVGTSADASYWTAGVAYETGPFGVSVTYLDSESGVNDDFTNVSVGADYALAPGITPYAEVSFFDADVGGTTVGDNEGTVAIIGATVDF